MKAKRSLFRLTIFLMLSSAQLFAFYSESGQFFAKPANHQEAQSRIANTIFAKSTSRPVRTEHYLSPAGYFIIHYDNSGFDAVPQKYTYNDTIPDFVFKAAQYLDSSFLTLRDSLGFTPPPQDDPASPEIDVYFRYDRTYYGVTNLETNMGNDSWTSYLTLSTLLEDSTIFYTHGLEGLRVTCAHELFHIFQLGYIFRSQDRFYFEMSSVWFEEYMYPEVNDYHAYINSYSKNWNYPINSSTLDYNNVGFNLYLDKRFSKPGNNIIKGIWDRILYDNALNSIRSELEYQGVRFEKALRDWGSAQVLCGPYSAENFNYSFDDASDLKTISFENNADMIVDGLETDINLSLDPGVFYYKLGDLPEQFFLFDMILSEGTDANLICLNGKNSKVLPFNDKALFIDGSQYSDYILVIGLDADMATGSLAVSEFYENQLSGVWPNPLYQENELSLAYVLLDDNQKTDIAIYDLSGKKVYSHSPADIYRKAGLQEIMINPHNLASGIYIIAVQTDEGVIAEKFTFIK
ncbi:MAG: T9SS type A sorting domain-containing protein [Candidatus Neomarinimicrobiota bacterium]